MDEYLTNVTDDELLSVPGLRRLRQKLLTSALKFYKEFTEERASDPGLQTQLAGAHYRIGRIYHELGRGGEAKKAYERAILLYEKLREAGHEDVEILAALADAHFFRDEHEKTIALCGQILARSPHAIAVRRRLGASYNQLAVRAFGDRDVAKALGYHRQALVIRQEIATAAPDDPVTLLELAATLNNLGVMLDSQRPTQDALTMFLQAVEVSEKAFVQSPHDPLYGGWLATSHENVASHCRHLGRKEEALGAYQRAVQVRRKLAFDNSALPRLKSELYKAHVELGDYQRWLGRTPDAERSYRAAREILENLPRETAQDFYALAAVYGALAEGPQGDGVEKADAARQAEMAEYAGQALDALQKAVAAGYRDLGTLKSDPSLASVRSREEFRNLLAPLEAAEEAGRLAVQGTEDAGRLAARQQEVGARRKLADQAPTSRHLQAALAASMHAVGTLELAMKRRAEAEKSLGESLAIRRKLHAQQPQDAAVAVDLAETHVALGELHWQTERLAQAHQQFQEGLRLLARAASQRPGAEALQERIASSEDAVCDKYGSLGLWDLAAARSRQSLALGRTADPQWDVRFGVLLAAIGDSRGYREYCRSVAESLGKKDPEGMAWMIAHQTQPAEESRK